MAAGLGQSVVSVEVGQNFCHPRTHPHPKKGVEVAQPSPMRATRKVVRILRPLSRIFLSVCASFLPKPITSAAPSLGADGCGAPLLPWARARRSAVDSFFLLDDAAAEAGAGSEVCWRSIAAAAFCFGTYEKCPPSSVKVAEILCNF